MERNKFLELPIHHAARIGQLEMVQILAENAPKEDAIGK